MKSILLTIAILIAGLYFYSFNFLVVVLAISFLIFFHELGHFLVAKMFGVCVTVFSVGFGDKVVSKKIGETEYRLSAIPLGGYVSLKGQEDLDPTARSDDKDSYNSLSPFKRILILFAGPFFNIILAFFLYIILGYVGVEKLAPKIGLISENSAAFEAGLKVGDEILEINSQKITEWEEISKNVKLEPLNLKIKRGNDILNITLTPKIGEKENMFREKIKVPLIGISPKSEFVRIYNKGFNSITYALNETYKASTLILVSFEKLVSGVVPVKEMGGIIAITDITAKASSNLSVLLIIVALISVNLGIINLFPVPALDGGHIVFNLYELIFKKPVPQKVFVGLSYVGIGLLLTIMVFTVVNDIMRITGAYK